MSSNLSFILWCFNTKIDFHHNIEFLILTGKIITCECQPSAILHFVCSLRIWPNRNHSNFFCRVQITLHFVQKEIKKCNELFPWNKYQDRNRLYLEVTKYNSSYNSICDFKIFTIICQINLNYSLITVLFYCSVYWLIDHSFLKYQKTVHFLVSFLSYVTVVWVGKKFLFIEISLWSLIPPRSNFSFNLRIECNLYFSIGLARYFVKVIFDWKRE